MELTGTNRVRFGAVAALVFLLALALYLFTMPPDVGWGDGADFVLSSYFLGVAHPTGYPLFTLLGKLAAGIPVGTLACKVALISVFSGALAAAVFYIVAARVAGPALALYPTAVLAVSTFLWMQAVSIEVYTLNLLFCLCMLLLAAPIGRGGLRGLLALVFVACVGLGNHGTLILPALALGVIGIIAVRKNIVMAALGSAFLVLLCFTLYACLPLFSARTDLFDWNMPTTLENFYVLLSGWDFWVIGEYKPDVMWANTKLLAGSIWRQAWPVLVVGFFLALFIGKKNRGVTWTILVVLLVSAFFPILYPTHEKEAFFLIACSMIILFGTMGLGRILENRDVWKMAVLVLLLVQIPIVVFVNYTKNNLRAVQKDESAGKYTEQILKSARRDALLFVDHVANDTIIPPLYYQAAGGMRRDVFIYHRLYTVFPWYNGYMRARAAVIGDDISIPEIDMEVEKNRSYRISLEEHNRLMEGKTLNTVSIDIQTRKLYDANKQKRPVYINSPARFRKSVLSDEIPIRTAGFLFRLGDGFERLPKTLPVVLNGVYNDVVFDYFSERAYASYRSKDVKNYAGHLETALRYSDPDWAYGELAGAYRELGNEEKAREYEEEYTKRKLKDKDDFLKP